MSSTNYLSKQFVTTAYSSWVPPEDKREDVVSDYVSKESKSKTVKLKSIGLSNKSRTLRP